MAFSTRGIRMRNPRTHRMHWVEFAGTVPMKQAPRRWIQVPEPSAWKQEGGKENASAAFKASHRDLTKYYRAKRGVHGPGGMPADTHRRATQLLQFLKKFPPQPSAVEVMANLAFKKGLTKKALGPWATMLRWFHQKNPGVVSGYPQWTAVAVNTGTLARVDELLDRRPELFDSGKIADALSIKPTKTNIQIINTAVAILDAMKFVQRWQGENKGRMQVVASRHRFKVRSAPFDRSVFKVLDALVKGATTTAEIKAQGIKYPKGPLKRLEDHGFIAVRKGRARKFSLEVTAVGHEAHFGQVNRKSGTISPAFRRLLEDKRSPGIHKRARDKEALRKWVEVWAARLGPETPLPRVIAQTLGISQKYVNLVIYENRFPLVGADRMPRARAFIAELSREVPGMAEKCQTIEGVLTKMEAFDHARQAAKEFGNRIAKRFGLDLKARPRLEWKDMAVEEIRASRKRIGELWNARQKLEEVAKSVPRKSPSGRHLRRTVQAVDAELCRLTGAGDPRRLENVLVVVAPKGTDWHLWLGITGLPQPIRRPFNENEGNRRAAAGSSRPSAWQ